MEKNTNNIDEIYLQGQKAFYALREEAQTSGCAGMSLDLLSTLAIPHLREMQENISLTSEKMF